MAKLLKLQICGIRNFGPNEEHVQRLSFDSPLTLLVGANGCGKTTVIEAIKYACTGDLPEGTLRGQGFVHDPKVSSKAITRGQIRLKLIDAKGDTHLIIKSVQLKQDAVGLKFSSVDSSIAVVRSSGDKEQLSGRCMDIDKYCAQLLQVSPSILNNVIFCHQENASWPLDEGKKVKEKFDAIFDSKKYIKCGEMITKSMKAKTDAKKLLQLEVNIAKEKKNEVLREHKKLLEKKEKLNSLIDNMKQNTDKLAPIKLRLDEIEKLEIELGALQKYLSSKTTERKGIVEQQNMLKQSITNIFKGTDEELNENINSFEQKQKLINSQVESLNTEIKILEKQEILKDKEIQKAQIKLGQLKEEKKQYDAKKKEEAILFETAKRSLEITGDFSWNTKEESYDAIEKLKSKLGDLKMDLETLRKQNLNQECDLQENTDKVRESVASLKEKLCGITHEKKKIQDKRLQISNEMQDLDTIQTRINQTSDAIEKIARTLKSLESKMNEQQAEAEMSKIKKDISNMENRLEELENLYKILQQNHVIEEKLNIEEQQRTKKVCESNKIKNKHLENFKKLFGNDIPTENLGRIIQNVLDKNEKEVNEIKSEIVAKQENITKVDTQIKHKKKDLQNLQAELREKTNEINSVCQGKNYDQLLNDTQANKEKLQKEKGQYRSAKIMYEKYIEKFELERPCCPICDTDFVNKKPAVRTIIQKLNQQIKSLPQLLQKTETELVKQDNLFNKLQRLKPIHDTVEMLSSGKIPFLQEEISEDENNLKALQVGFDELNAKLKIPSGNIQIGRILIRDATLLDQYNIDIKNCEGRMKSLKKELKDVGTKQSKDEVENEIEILKADISSLRNSLETSRLKLDQHKKRCRDLREEKEKLSEEFVRYQTQAHSKPSLMKQLEELEERLENILMDEGERKIELEEVENKLKTLAEEKKRMIEGHNKALNEKREEILKKQDIVKMIVKLNTEINRYSDKNIDNLLEQAVNQVTNVESEKKIITDKKLEIFNQISQHKEDIAKQNTNLRNLKDNKTLREKKKEESKLLVEISEVENKIGNYNYRTVYEEKVKLRRKVENIEKEINNTKGQELELRDNIGDLERDMMMPENMNAEKTYRAKYYELKMTERAELDLQAALKALHCSILQFHKERMVQINRRIKELWRDVYRGNDIDYIEIQAEESKGNHTVRQSYNYKVIQIKSGVELEMRGRCSAGQRVLACLIIRMALAESFSIHCGILALDEPTTNLDKDNVNSLTLAISNIVANHSNNHNFQLIVITHDQEFLNILRHNVQNVSHYWRLDRDSQGYSIITKERV